MTSPDVGKFTFGAIQAALRRTSEHLVREVVVPQDRAPDWNEFEWKIARSVCAMQGISAILASRLRWSAPPEFKSFLDAQLAHGQARHAQAGTTLAALDAGLRERGVAAVALKGSALRALGLHADGERPMGDIDLLVKPADVAACAQVVAGLDYLPLYSSRRHDVFTPRVRRPAPDFGEHRDHPLKIEVHSRVSEALPVRDIEITHALWPATPVAGLNPYASPAALLRHVLLHAANCLRANAARFIHLYDIGLLSSRMSGSDWVELLGHHEDRERTWWMFPPLSLTSKYVPGCIPPDILERCRALCPHWLRLRYVRREFHAVSWCNLRIAALPGIEWSRTSGDVVRFARSRLLPDRVARAELATTSVSQPQLMRVPWYGVSHAERIVRWVFARPPRVQTIVAVSAALQTENSILPAPPPACGR
jgi:hypothetical protein